MSGCNGQELPWKLWIYTNFDCNLSCTYCLASSTPRTPRQEISVDTVQKLVDEAVGLGFQCVYFTGGEPMLLDTIYDMLAYSAERVTTTLLTNAMLVNGRRLEHLAAIHHPNLIVQVSLDGSRPETHDAFRGAGSWDKTIVGIRHLQERGLHVRLSTTETPANSADLEGICAFHLSLNIPEEDHIVRPLARRGASQFGMEISRETLLPELTVSRQGVYWHPLSTDEDMLVSKTIFPLASHVQVVMKKLQSAQALQTVQ
jgi:MoaA/NifB/PqqE/SkfB family radical SAM enzyme